MQYNKLNGYDDTFSWARYSSDTPGSKTVTITSSWRRAVAVPLIPRNGMAWGGVEVPGAFLHFCSLCGGRWEVRLSNNCDWLSFLRRWIQSYHTRLACDPAVVVMLESMFNVRYSIFDLLTP